MLTGEEAASVPLEYQRLLTEADFSRIRELRHEKLVGELMRKHGLKSSAKRERLLAAAQDEAEDALEKLASPSFAQPTCSPLQSGFPPVCLLLQACCHSVAHTASCALFDAGGGGLLLRSAPSAAVFTFQGNLPSTARC